MSSEILSLEDVAPLQEVQATGFEELRPHMAENRPFVVRGLVKDWPLVQAGLQSGKAARDYLLTKARDVPFVVNIGSPEHDGRMFYQHDMSMNTQMGKARLPLVFERIDRVEANKAVLSKRTEPYWQENRNPETIPERLRNLLEAPPAGPARFRACERGLPGA